MPSIQRRVTHWFSTIQARERMLILVATACISVYLIYLPISAVLTHIDETEREAIIKTRELENLGRVLKRYNSLNQRLEKFKARLVEGETTFEGVTRVIDNIVKKILGSSDYELKKKSTPSKFGFDFEKQGFTLTVKSLNLEQLVKLLFELEEASNRLFLGSVDVLRARDKGSFTTTLEIFSIRKQS